MKVERIQRCDVNRFHFILQGFLSAVSQFISEQRCRQLRITRDQSYRESSIFDNAERYAMLSRNILSLN